MKPNIVIILADDLGNADLGCRGSDIKMPNIDKLANEGVWLESFYGMPVCTLARAELMTGCYAMRYGSAAVRPAGYDDGVYRRNAARHGSIACPDR
jgi:arylsulfatase A-like enzyme